MYKYMISWKKKVFETFVSEVSYRVSRGRREAGT